MSAAFTLDETKAILKHPQVHAAMQSIVRDRSIVPPRNPPPWMYGDKPVPTGPFRLFRASVEAAVRLALDTAKDRDRERLLILLRLTEGQDTPATILAVGLTCEEYAVAMQQGPASLPSWRAFNHR